MTSNSRRVGVRGIHPKPPRADAGHIALTDHGSTRPSHFVSNLEIWATRRAGAKVTLGDSITDGFGARQGDYEDWPDQLAKRLAADGAAQGIAMLSEGIDGNRILHDGAGISALARFDRECLSAPWGEPSDSRGRPQ